MRVITSVKEIVARRVEAAEAEVRIMQKAPWVILGGIVVFFTFLALIGFTFQLFTD